MSGPPSLGGLREWSRGRDKRGQHLPCSPPHHLCPSPSASWSPRPSPHHPLPLERGRRRYPEPSPPSSCQHHTIGMLGCFAMHRLGWQIALELRGMERPRGERGESPLPGRCRWQPRHRPRGPRGPGRQKGGEGGRSHFLTLWQAHNLAKGNLRKFTFAEGNPSLRRLKRRPNFAFGRRRLESEANLRLH